jgi:hypothetical protein
MAELKPTTVTIVELTAKEYAAIHLCVPDSGNDELDAMIRGAQRERLAGQAMQGLMMKYSLNQKHFEIGDMETVAKYSNLFADALIAAGEVKP